MTRRELNPTPGRYWHGRWSAGTIEPNRRLYDFELVYFHAGKGRVITERGSYDFAPEQLLILPPNLVHCTVAVTAVERYCLHFDWYGDCLRHRSPEPPYVFCDDEADFRPELSAGAPDLSELSFPCFRQLEPGAATELRRLLRAFGESGSEWTAELRKRGLLLEILALSGAAATPETAVLRHNRTFLKAKSRIDAGFRQPGLSVSGLAAELGITANHLAKLFRAELGRSPSGYLQQQRLALAEQLLRSGAHTVREVAFLSGFEDPNYFSRLFRQRFGRTPSELLRSGD